MSSKINLLIINCRDFNFPHAGNCDVRLMRVKHSVRVKVITYLPKRISTRTEFYISHTENFIWDSITNNGVKLIYAELLDRLNYTDRFTAHYGYSDGDVAGAYENDVEYISWLTATLFSFNADKKPTTVDELTGKARTVTDSTGRSAMESIRGGIEASKELKVSPLAEKFDALRSKVAKR